MNNLSKKFRSEVLPKVIAGVLALALIVVVASGVITVIGTPVAIIANQH